MKKPIILISFKYVPDTDKFGIGRICSIRSNYCRAVIRAGGVPVISALGDADAYAEMADGIIFSGGSCDVDPFRYGEENRMAWDCDYEIDEMELDLFRAFYARKKPMLGVCRGIQIMNVALGGTLVQDIITECPDKPLHIRLREENADRHKVYTAEGSLLASLFGREFMTNSHHHEAVKDLGEGLRAAARTEDGLIEAIEHESLPITAVQWHPERMTGEENYDLPDMTPLFRRFVDSCR